MENMDTSRKDTKQTLNNEVLKYMYCLLQWLIQSNNRVDAVMRKE
jgi:hypothetical protein